MPKVRKLACVQREERIVKAFKIALVEKDWTLKHLSEVCGIDYGNISRIINHPMKVRLETILIIANKLGIDSIPT